MPDTLFVQERFRFFSELETHGVPVFYGYLSKNIIQDEELLRLASRTQEGQPPPNMLFGAVHDLLLSGCDHPLKRYYASICKPVQPIDDKTWPLFKDLCKKHHGLIAKIISTRRTQTNEAGRSALFLPAFACFANSFGNPKIHYIEIGASAGFNLNWQHYRYRYGEKSGEIGAESSKLTLRTELRGPHPLPKIDFKNLVEGMAMRSGVELHPIDIENASDARWLKALTWPEQTVRFEQLNKAIEIAMEHPPPITKGSFSDHLPALINSTPEDMIPLVYHSFVRYQFDTKTQVEFDNIFFDHSRNRPVARVSIEWTGLESPVIMLDNFREGRLESKVLATCNPHGKWLRWSPAIDHD